MPLHPIKVQRAIMRIACVMLPFWALSAAAQNKMTPPVIEGFSVNAPSIVAPGNAQPRKRATKAPKRAQSQAKPDARTSQPSPAGLYRNTTPMNALLPPLAAPMPNPNAFKVPPPVPPASPLASPPPGQSCDPFGPGHCGLKRR